MTEEEKKTPKKAASKAAAPKAKPAAEKSAEPKVAKPKAAPKQKPAVSGATIKVVQIGSPIGRQANQRQTLIGLGLNKMGRTRELQDTPAVRGMIYKVRHLVKVVG